MKANPNFIDLKSYRLSLIFESIGILIVFLLVYALCSIWNVSERFYVWAQQYEATGNIDELVFALMGSLFALMWFAKRRVDESRKLSEHNRFLLQRLLQVQEIERKAIAQHLHDDLGQYLNAIKVNAIDMMSDAIDQHAQLAAQRIHTSADHAYQMTRRMMQSLRPIDLDEHKLSEAIKQLIDICQSTCRQHAKSSESTQYQLDIVGNIDTLPENMNIAIFRIVQEALNNSAKHANATLVQVLIKNMDGILTVTVQDNGIGADMHDKRSGQQNGYGLLGIAERVEALAGKLNIISVPSQGFAILVEINLK